MIGDDYSHGSFELTYTIGDQVWYLAVHPEMYPARQGIKPSGNYCIYCVHPTNGSCHFLVEQDEDCKWYCERFPPFIPPDFIAWLGSQIEAHNG